QNRVEDVAVGSVDQGARLVAAHDLPAAGPDAVDELPEHVVAGAIVEVVESTTGAETGIGAVVAVEQQGKGRAGNADVRAGAGEVPKRLADHAIGRQGVGTVRLRIGEEGDGAPGLGGDLPGAGKIR